MIVWLTYEGDVMFLATDRHSILILSDDDTTRFLLIKCIELSNHTVIGAATIIQALQVLSSNSIDLIIIDASDFKTNEVALYNEIRVFSNIPIIISTTPYRMLTQPTDKSLNDPTFLTKPYRFTDLMSCISLTLRAKDLVRLAHSAFEVAQKNI